MQLRSTVVTAAVSAAAALAATGITYASAASASAPAPEQAAATAAPHGGSNNNNSKGNEGNNSKGNEGNDDNDYNDNNGHRGEDEGRIQINERSYSTHPGDCITVVSGLGAKSLNIRNDSRKTVEVFRGAVCDNGAPVATVGPHSSSDGVRPGCVEGIDIDKGVVASFRVIKRHHED
ncbi:hypothetical protein AQJ66_24225 [Streptomyces bungoensis]|uniref:Uncharacterized protein n=1 Tax=Streptomyces bungoensis TaxID=285568 RepID=A0A124I2T0_9ACTN|nr:hypothetical protein [Streptomyces bungoensis]KUN81506.1 hypothetical protein AQJ66_24225 [Streptomyces bungoensis]